MKQARLNENGKIVITFKKLTRSEWYRVYNSIKNLPTGMRKFISSSKEWVADCNDVVYDKLQELNFHIDPLLFRKMNNTVIDETWKNEKIPIKYKYLYPDQVEIFKFLKYYGWKGLIAADMGSGKTNTALSVLDYTELFPALIICPTIVKYNWVSQHKKWLGHSEDKIKIIETSSDLKNYHDEFDIYIVNYQLLARAMVKVKTDTGGFIFMPKNELKSFYDNFFETVIIDEVHKCKGNESQTTNAVRYLCDGATSILELSGTPILNSNKDIFPPLNILDAKEFNNYFKFCKRYCFEADRYKGKTKLQGAFYGSRNSEELNLVLSNGYMIRQDQKYIKECRGEEYLIPNITVLPIKPVKKSKYLEAEKAFGSGLGSDDKKTSFGKLSKMRVEAWNLKKKACFQFIDDLIEETNDKIVIFAHNKIVLNDLVDYYKKQIVFIDGSVDTKNDTRGQIVTEFVTNSTIKFIAISIEAGNAGIDGLQFGSHTMVFLQDAWNEGVKQQCYGRLSNRTGQESITNIFHLICEGTIDEMFLALQDKKKAEITKAIDGELLEESELMRNIFKFYQDKYKRGH